MAATSSLARWLSMPAAASVFAGFVGAGLVDAAVVLLGGGEAGAGGAEGRAGEVLALAVGLWGAAGAIAGVALGWAVAVIGGAIPGGFPALREDARIDRRAATALLAFAGAAVVLAGAMGAGHVALVAGMHSRVLATIATAGLAVIGAVPAALVGLALARGLDRLLGRLPRPARVGYAGAALGLLGAAAVLAFVAALSRADWRVLDLGPLKALAAAAALGAAHGAFWYRSAAGRRLHQRRPVAVKAIRAGALAVAGGLLFVGARVPESSGTYAALTERSWSLRLGLSLARRLADGDGDGFAARFGGGDCDDRRADVHPGAVDEPGDGVDQNCEGGDATGGAAAAGAGATGAGATGAGARPGGAGTAGAGTPPAGATGGAGAGAAPGGAAGAAGPRRRSGPAFDGNLLIITVDSLRADRLGAAGYGRPPGRSLTPTLDALVKRGAYFRRAWAQAPNTPRSFPSFLTARWPSDIAWKDRIANYSPILPENETFFEALAAAGWRTIGIFSHFYFTADRGISQGFAEWSNEGAGTIAESNKDIASPRIVPRVIARLRQAAAAGERFALWTHLFEPHSSYMEHAAYPTTIRGGVRSLEEKYDYEIAFVDGWIGKLVAALEETGLAARTALVVLADHGEAWGEHRQYFHGTDLTEEQLRVPLVFVVPGQAPREITDPVALVDVGPTLMDLVGLEPLPAFRGRSLLPLMRGEPLPPRPVFGELLPAKSWPKHETMMVEGALKVTHKVSERRWELHDLSADPRQQTDLARDPRHAPTLDPLKRRLLDFEEGKR